MAKRNEKVFEALQKFVKKTPEADVDQAVKAARKVDSSIDPDDKRSFNARYLLPAKRRAGVTGQKKQAKKKTKKSKAKKTRKRRTAASKRNQARQLILERDQRILELAKGELDAKEAYRLAADVDEFLAELKKAL